MSISPCPSTAEIVAHVRERFSESIGAHLMECDSCMNLYERFFEERYGETIAGIPAIHPGSTSDTDDTVPDRIGVYEIRNIIGRGGMGTVFEAVHTELGKPVAVKLIRSTDPHFLDRFQREKRIAGRFRHPNVVEATDAGTFHGKPYLVSELLTGSDLEKWVQTHGPLPWEQAVEVVTQTAKGLAYLHREGVVHRDIKPSNLFLCRNTSDRNDTANESPSRLSGYGIKILDVGLAKRDDDDRNDALTATGDILGSYDYIAPEQIKSVKRADRRSDIYSLGCTFHYLLTGAAPYSGNGCETKGEKIAAHLDPAEIPDIRTALPHLPAPLAKLIADMTAKAPARRPASVDAVLERLETLILSIPNERAATSAFTRKPLVVGIAALLAVLVVVTLGAVYFVHADKSRPPHAEMPAPLTVQAVQPEPEEPPPVEPPSVEPDALHVEAVKADPIPAPPVTTTPVETDQGITVRQPAKWNPGVRRPSTTITPIPSGRFDDEEDE